MIKSIAKYFPKKKRSVILNRIIIFFVQDSKLRVQTEADLKPEILQKTIKGISSFTKKPDQ